MLDVIDAAALQVVVPGGICLPEFNLIASTVGILVAADRRALDRAVDDLHLHGFRDRGYKRACRDVAAK